MDLFPNSTFFIQLGIFLSVVFILSKLVFNPVVSLIEERRRRSSGTLEKLTELEEGLRTKVAHYEKALAEAHAQALVARDEIRADARKEEKHIISIARKESDAALSALQVQLQSDVHSAKTSLDKQASDLAALIVKKVWGAGKVLSFLILMAVPLVSLPAFASAEAHETHGVPFSLVYQFINFFGLLTLLYIFLKKPIVAFFASRKEDIAGALSKADAQRKEFETRSRDLETRIGTLDDQIRALKESIISTSKLEKDQLLAQATATADRIRREVALTAEQETKKAQEALTAHATALALRLATEDLERKSAQDTTHEYDRTALTQLRGAL